MIICHMQVLGSIIIIIITLLQLSTEWGASSTSDGNDRPPYERCPDNEYSYSSGSLYEQNLDQALLELTNTAASQTYSRFVNGTGVDEVYALYYCRGDVGVDTCHECIQNAVQEIVNKCEFKKQAIVWYEFCTLRYANHTIFSFNEDEISLKYRHLNRSSLYVNEVNLNPHRPLFISTMEDLIGKAAKNKNPIGFATNEANLSASMTIFGTAQCSPLISSNQCEKCLNYSLSRMDKWSVTIVFMPSCNIKFDLDGSSLTPSSPRPPSPISDPLPERYKILLEVLLPVVLFFSIVGGFWCWRRYRSSGEKTNENEDTEVETSNIDELRLQLAQFTYSQVKNMTNGFNRKLGEGGYGIVYYGRLSDDNNKEVAVKVLSKNDGPMQFSNEIRVLGRIYHKNLVTLIGYCEEGINLALVYEYLSGGDLKALLSESSNTVVSWKRRLEIAFDTAQGLDYLHTGCSPPIVHRDVKPANILLNQHLQAKVADFGFSKIFPPEYVSRLETRVIGTIGYVDPQYHLTGQVNEKSDVYSFGVVLLELITGKTAIINSNTNLVQWVTPLFERGDIDSILDPRLRIEVGENYNTVWRVTELAKNCVELTAIHRPTMIDIVTELRDCLARENADVMSPISAYTSIEMSTATISTTSISPQPR